MFMSVTYGRLYLSSLGQGGMAGGGGWYGRPNHTTLRHSNLQPTTTPRCPRRSRFLVAATQYPALLRHAQHDQAVEAGRSGAKYGKASCQMADTTATADLPMAMGRERLVVLFSGPTSDS